MERPFQTTGGSEAARRSNWRISGTWQRQCHSAPPCDLRGSALAPHGEVCGGGTETVRHPSGGPRLCQPAPAWYIDGAAARGEAIMAFVDRVTIFVKGGDGGSGMCSF